MTGECLEGSGINFFSVLLSLRPREAQGQFVRSEAQLCRILSR